MNRQLKRSIQKAFEAPKPNEQEKADFLKNLHHPPISMWQFILTQATYLRKKTWIFSALLLLPAVIGAFHIGHETLWITSAIVPFLGLLAVAENSRSITYGMSEFELSTRFSLKSVVLARMSILGVLDFTILACLVPLCWISNTLSIIQTGIYIVVPYLLTVNVSLWVTRHVHSRDNIYGCMSVAVLVSGIDLGLHYMVSVVYSLSYFGWWLAVAFFLIVIMAHEIYYTIKQMEEYSWNWLSTD